MQQYGKDVLFVKHVIESHLNMDIRTTFNKIRAYGPKVVVQYLLRNWRLSSITRRVLQVARKRPLVPMPGITVAGQLTDSGSTNKTLRDFLWALKESGIPYQTVDFGYKHDAYKSDYEGLLTDPDEFNLTKFNYLVELGKTPIPDGVVLHRAGIHFWEYDSGVIEAFPEIVNNETVIAMCDFNYDYYKKVLPPNVRVAKVLYPFRFKDTAGFDVAAIRGKYGFKQSDFIVFFNYNFKTGYNRKNPKASIRAFSKAFKNILNAKLLFKTQKAKMFPAEAEELRMLAVDLGVGSRFQMLDTYIPEEDIYGLTAACDVYLSLHRGEGFGLGMAEAMSLGKPVVATNYSANTEFTVDGCSIPVPYKMVPVENIGCDPAYYKDVKTWPEPDVDYAADALLRLYNNPILRKEIGEKARRFIKEHFSIVNFRASMQALLSVS